MIDHINIAAVISRDSEAYDYSVVRSRMVSKQLFGYSLVRTVKLRIRSIVQQQTGNYSGAVY